VTADTASVPRSAPLCLRAFAGENLCAAPPTYPLQPEVNQKNNIFRKNPSTGVLDNISATFKQNQALEDTKLSHFTDSCCYISQSGTTVRKMIFVLY
jgi:hypothetical protein